MVQCLLPAGEEHLGALIKSPAQRCHWAQDQGCPGCPAMFWGSHTAGTAWCLPGPGGSEGWWVLRSLMLQGCGAQRVQSKALLALH